MLQVRLLGSVELSNDGVPLQEFPTQKSKALFAMLILRSDRVFSRERIVNVFWTDLPEKRGQKCLSSDLWRIKEVIKSGGLAPDAYLAFREQSVGFNATGAHWLDVHSFEQNLSALKDIPPEKLTENDLECLEKSIELYRGELLDDVYDDWILVQREALRAEYVRALETVMYYHTYQLHLAEAITCGQKLLGLDPLLEHIHRELMLCYYRIGNRSAALRQYALCEELLWTELKVEPMEETREIYQRLVSAGPVKSLIQSEFLQSISPPRAAATSHRPVSQSVKLAMEKLETAHSLLQDAQARLESDG